LAKDSDYNDDGFCITRSNAYESDTRLSNITIFRSYNTEKAMRVEYNNLLERYAMQIGRWIRKSDYSLHLEVCYPEIEGKRLFRNVGTSYQAIRHHISEDKFYCHLRQKLTSPL
jgi:hypothetical protein